MGMGGPVQVLRIKCIKFNPYLHYTLKYISNSLLNTE
jgi:hypothetical protein